MLTALRFSFQDLLHDRSRTLLSSTGLAVIIASYFIMYALSQAFASYLDFTLIGRNLLVLQKGMYNPSDARLGPEVIQAAQELMPRMVNRISPTVFRYTRVGDHVVPLSAAELQHWQPVFQLELVKGEWPTGGKEIIVSEGLAYVSGWEVGSALDNL